MELRKQTLLIAGCSSGIGRAFALEMAKRGNNIVITARRESLLEALAGEIEAVGSRCLSLPCDALCEEDAKRVIEQATAEFGSVDFALLNVGDGPSFNMSKCSAKAIKDNMATNYDTLVNYLVPLIQQMKSQGHGVIAHTNSLAGFLGLPMQGPYSAAKAAGRILMATCRIELKKNNIRFLTLYPGFIATERVAEDGIPAPFEMTEKEAVNHMIHAIEKEKNDYLFPFPLRWLIRLARVLPKPLTGWLLSKSIPADY